MVYLLKIALPSIAALVFGALLLIPAFKSIKSSGFVMPKFDAKNDVSFMLDEGNFLGRGDKGVKFEVRAKRLVENKGKNFAVEDVSARATFADGGWVRLYSDSGEFAGGRKVISLRGGVRVVDSDGNRATTSEAIVELDADTISGSEPILAETPFGYMVGEGFFMRYGEVYRMLGRVTARGRME